MAIFNYVAKDLQGNYHKGEVDTVDVHEAAQLLRRKKLIVISLKEPNANTNNLLDRYLNRVSFTDLVVITRQLATMIEAGLVLSESLDILAEQQSKKTVKKVLEDIASDVKGGMEFAAALEKRPEVFPKLYINLVKAGEASGKLDTVLLQLANNLEKEREFKSKIRGAMIYPIIVITMMFAVMLVMIFFVMPKLTALYTQSNIDLPLPTKILIAFSNFLINFWWVVIGLVALSVFLFRRWLATEKGRFTFDSLIIKLPIVGPIVTEIILTDFTRTLALLISAGIPILETIKIVADVVGNMAYKKALDESYQGVERGLTFSNQILGYPIFPKIVGQMIRTGEETGKLDEVMFKLATYFESESDNALKNITTLIEPLVLIILGIGVAFLVLSIILPIYKLTTSIQ